MKKQQQNRETMAPRNGTKTGGGCTYGSIKDVEEQSPLPLPEGATPKTSHATHAHAQHNDNVPLLRPGKQAFSDGNSPSHSLDVETENTRDEYDEDDDVDDRSHATHDSLLHDLVDHAFSLQGRPCGVHDCGGGTATMENEVFNMVKNLVGAGALGLPSGVAAFANAPSALIPAAFIIVVMGAVFGYYFHLMGRICKFTDTATYREAWEETVGARGAIWVPIFTTLMAGLGNLAYSMILADTTRSLSMTILGWELSRNVSLIVVTLVALLPLCFVKRLQVLAPFSLVGMAGMVFTVGAMAVRYFDGSYDPSRGGKHLADLPIALHPSFGVVGAMGALSVNVLILVCMTYQAFFCHYNAPRYYVELKNNTVRRFGIVVTWSFGISAATYVAMTAFGFLTFGANCNGFILNNYSTSDNLATVCRIAIAVALVFTYPLPFIGTRDGILDLLAVPVEKQTSSNLNVLTLVLLAIITALASQFEDLGIVNAVGGAALGTAVVFVFPALMFRGAVVDLGLMENASAVRLRREAIFSLCLMWVGIAMGAIGIWVAVSF